VVGMFGGYEDCVFLLIILLARCLFCTAYNSHVPKSVSARPNVWVCGRSLAGIVGSNPAG